MKQCKVCGLQMRDDQDVCVCGEKYIEPDKKVLPKVEGVDESGNLVKKVVYND